MKKRSDFTDYVYDEVVVYEYKNKFFVMEMCQQGQVLNPAHGSRQSVSDIAFLSACLSLDCTSAELGSAVLKALDSFDTRAHPYDKFDDVARRKHIAGSVGARGLATLERDSRTVFVVRYFKENEIKISPTDNNNRKPWVDTINTEEILLPTSASAEEIGKATLQAFAVSLFHPNKKN